MPFCGSRAPSHKANIRLIPKRQNRKLLPIFTLFNKLPIDIIMQKTTLPPSCKNNNSKNSGKSGSILVSHCDIYIPLFYFNTLITVQSPPYIMVSPSIPPITKPATAAAYELQSPSIISPGFCNLKNVMYQKKLST